MGQQRPQLGSEKQRPVLLGVVERLLPETVPHQMQHPVLAIPQGQGKHAVDAIEGGAQPPGADRLHHHLGVAVTAKEAAVVGESGPQLDRVVALAVVGDHPPAVGRHHGLVTGRREVDDG